MSARALEISYLLMFITFGILIANASGMFPDSQAKAYSGELINETFRAYEPEVSDGEVQQLAYAVVAISSFGLLILALPFMLALFAYSSILTEYYLADLPIPLEWKVPLMVGAMITYVLGFNEYRARQTV